MIDNSVVVLENIFRHLELGEPPDVAAERGGQEVALPVLAATLATVVVFFPGHVSVRRQPLSVYGAGLGGGSVAVRFLFRGDDRRAVVLREVDQGRTQDARAEANPPARKGWGARFNRWFNRQFQQMLDRYEGWLNWRLLRPRGDGARHHRHFHVEPGPLSVGRRGVFPAHRSRPVRHQPQGARPARGSETDRPVGGKGGADRPRSGAGRRN